MSYKDPAMQREYARKWMAERRKRWFDENGPCVACGSYINLELDHIVPSPGDEHKVWSWSEQRRNKELAKCQVLCHDCHAKKTKIQLQVVVSHGTRINYNRGCRCAECRLANANYQYMRRHGRS